MCHLCCAAVGDVTAGREQREIVEQAENLPARLVHNRYYGQLQLSTSFQDLPPMHQRSDCWLHGKH